MVCVMVMCRPVSSRRMTPLVKNLPLVRGGDLQLLAVFGDGAPRELEPFALEDADDLRIAQRLPRILLLDDFADPLLDGDRGNRLAVGAGDAAVEEVLHLEH